MSLKDQSPRCVTVSFPGVGAGMGDGGGWGGRQLRRKVSPPSKKYVATVGTHCPLASFIQQNQPV